MAAPTIIRSTDSGAPAINGVSGQLIVVLDYILVTRLGWTKEFTGTYKAVYRPSAGNRLFYHIDNSTGNSGTGYSSSAIKAYESMTAINTGMGMFGPNYPALVSFYDDAAASREWIAIGDSKGVWIWHVCNNSGVSVLRYFGDALPLFSNDACLSLISGQPDGPVNTLLEGIGLLDATSTAYLQLRAWKTIDGKSRGVQTRIQSSGGVSSGLGVASGSLPAIMDYPKDGKLIYTRPTLSDANASRTVRGYLPGFYCPEHRYTSLTHNTIYTDGAKSLLFLRLNCWVGGEELGGCLIDIGEEFRP